MWLDCRVHPLTITNHYKCYLNGEFLEQCFAANEEEGWADIHVTDEKGKLIYNKKIKDVERKRLYGKVELRKVSF